MVKTYGNITKATFRADIKRKQQLFNRIKRRYIVANNAAERQFLRAEANRIVSDLKQCNKKWKTWGFGSCGWITRNFTVASFAGGSRTIGRKGASRRTNGRRNGRSMIKRSGMTRTRSRSRTRSSASRRTYFVW